MTRNISEALSRLVFFIVPRPSRDEGARYLRRRELGKLLWHRHTGLLIDGKAGRLSERHSFQNVCVVARV